MMQNGSDKTLERSIRAACFLGTIIQILFNWEKLCFLFNFAVDAKIELQKHFCETTNY